MKKAPVMKLNLSSRRQIENDIKFFEFMLNNYSFDTEERAQVNEYLINAKQQLTQYPSTKKDLKQAR